MSSTLHPPASASRSISVALFLLLVVAPRASAQSDLHWAVRGIGYNAAIALAPGDDILYSASHQTLRSFSTSDGSLLAQNVGQMLGTFSSDGRWMVRFEQNRLVLVDLALLRAVDSVSYDWDIGQPVSYHFSLDGSRLLVVGVSRLALYEVPALRQLWKVTSRPATAVAFSRSGEYIVWNEDDQLCLFRSATGGLVRRLEGRHAITSAALAEDDAIVVGYNGREIVTWNLWDGTRRQVVFDRETADNNRMLVDPSGRYVVTYAMYRAGDSTIRVWTPSNGARIRDYSPTTISYPINRMLFTHGGEHLVIHTVSGRATWFGLLDGATGRSIPNGISGGGVIRFSPDRSRIVVGSWLTMSFYDAATGRLESSYPTEGYAIRFSQDGSEWFQVTPVGGRTIMQIRRTEDGSLVRTIDLEPEWGPRDISPDFGSIATVTSSQSSPILSVYDAATAQLKYSIQRGGRAIHQIAFSQDGQMFAAWGDDHVVTVYGTAQGNVVREIYQPNASGFEFGDDGASLLISSQSGILVVALPFAPGGERLVPVPPYAGLPRTSSDRRFLLSAMRTVDVYSYRTGTRLHVYGDSLTSRAGGYHTAAEFEPGGGSIVTITTFGDILRFRVDGILGAPDDPVRDAGELHIAPSIASDRVRVSYDATEGGIARLELIDPAGRRVLARERAVEGGTVRDELDVSGLATGVYLMRVVLGERVLTARVMVMR